MIDISKLARILSTRVSSAEEDEQFAILPEGTVLHSLEFTQKDPYRDRGTMETSSLADFIQYINSKTSSSKRIFVNGETGHAKAVINFGSEVLPKWKDDLAYYGPTSGMLYQDLKVLMNTNRGQVSQQNLVDFIDDWGHTLGFFQGKVQVDMLQARQLFADITVEKLNSQRSNMSQSFERERSVAESMSMGAALPDFMILKDCEIVETVYSCDLAVRITAAEGEGPPSFTLRAIQQRQAEMHAFSKITEILSKDLSECQVHNGTYKRVAK